MPKLIDLTGAEVLPKKNSCPVKYPDTREFKNGLLHGYDQAVDAINSVEVVGDVDALAEFLFDSESHLFELGCRWEKQNNVIRQAYVDRAQAIITAIPQWVRLEKKV